MQNLTQPMRYLLYLLLFIPGIALATGSPAPAPDSEPCTGDLAVMERASYVNFANRDSFLIDGTDEMEITIGMEIPMTIEYHTAITADGVEQQLVQVAVRIRERNANGDRINPNESAFIAPIQFAQGAPNSDTVTVTFTVPAQDVSGVDIPLSADLPAGHYHTFDLILVEDMAAGGRAFTEDGGRVQIVSELGQGGGGDGGGMDELTARAASVELLNGTDYQEAGRGDTLSLVPGEVVDLSVAYATAVNQVLSGMDSTLVEDDLVAVNVRISRLNAMGGTVAQNRFAGATIIPAAAANADTAMVTYTVVDSLEDGTTFPLSADLGAGESYLFRIILVTETPDSAGRNFLEAAYPLALVAERDTTGAGGGDGGGMGTDSTRARFVDFLNADDYRAEDSDTLELVAGETIDITVAYATAIALAADSMSFTEDDLAGVNLRISRLDSNGVQLDQNVFAGGQLVFADAPNADTAMVTYTVINAVAGGGTYAVSDSLENGESYVLRFILLSDPEDGSGRVFTEARYPLNLIAERPNQLEDRTEFVEWLNVADLTMDGDSLPVFTRGDTIDMTIAYATEISNNQEADLDYVAVMLQELDADGNLFRETPFNAVVGEEAPNVDTFDYQFIIPENFNDDDMTQIPATVDLADGHVLRIAVFAQTDLAGALRYPNGNQLIVLDRPVSTDDRIAREIVGLYPNPTSADITLETSGTLRNMTVSVIDLMGRVVSNQRYDAVPNRVDISTSNLPAGTYLVRLADARGQVTRMIVKR